MDKQTLLAFIFLSSVAVSNGQSQDSFDQKLRSMYKLTVPLIHPDELAARLASDSTLVLLDIRTKEEFQVSHLHGARFIDFDTYTDRMTNGLDRQTPIVVYCAVGYRSERIGERLMAKGFKNVMNLYGGIFEWVNESHPIEDSQGMPTDMVHTYNREWSKWLVKGKKVY